MPIFEYVCQACQHAFEAIVHGAQRAKCPQCGGGRLDKQLSVFAAGKSSNGNGNGDFAAGGGCGSCGDPRGPGSCRLD